MLSVVAVSTPWKATVPVVSVMVTVVTSTPDWNVVPPDCVIVSTPMLVPTAPVTVAVPVVLRVRFSVKPPAVPVTEPTSIVFAMPVPATSVDCTPITTLPSVIAPVDAPPTVAAVRAATVTVVSLSPSVITPVVAAIKPAIVIADGAVATTPPAKVNVSPVSPSWSVPVLRKVVAPAIGFVPLVPPMNVRLYGWAAVTRAVEMTTTSPNRIEVVASVSVTVPTARAPATFTVSALVIVKPVSAVAAPTEPLDLLIDTMPVVPASIVSVPAPSIELSNATSEPEPVPPLVVSTVMFRPLRSTRPVNAM